MVRNDYRCTKCGAVIESFGSPTGKCLCYNDEWEVVFTSVPQVCFNKASVLEKIDEVNKNIKEEVLHESHKNDIGW